MSESFVNFFVAFVAGVPSTSIPILLAFVSDVNFDVLKYLSDTLNTIVTFLFPWSIVVFLYSYVNSGVIKSVNILLAVFAVDGVASFNIISVHASAESNAPILWFPYESTKMFLLYESVLSDLPSIFNAIFPLHSL